MTNWIAFATVMVGGSRQQEMDVISDAAYGERFHGVGPGNAAHVRPKTRLHVFCD